MTLSIASNAAGYSKPLGYGLAGLAPLASVAEATQRSDAAAPWSYKPPSAEAGRRDARLSDLLEVLSRLSADPDPTATGRSGQGSADASGTTSGPARSDAADLLQTLSDTGWAPAVPAHLSFERSSPEPDRQPVQALAQRPATDLMPAHPVGLSTQDVPADPSISAADAQLQALFKTLQEYGL